MPNYQLRISYPWTPDIADRVSRFALRIGCDEWVAYQHPATIAKRIHCHIYFFNAQYQRETVRNHIGEYITTYEGGNKTYSMSTTAGKNKGPITLEGAIKYASRNGTLGFVGKAEKYDSLALKTIEENAREDNDANIYIEAEVKSKTYQRTKWEIISHCLSEYDREKKKLERDLTAYEVVNIVLTALKELQQVVHSYRVQEILYTIKIHRRLDALEDRLIKYYQDI